MFVWILRNLRATLCNYMEGCAVLIIFNFAHGAIGWNGRIPKRDRQHCCHVCKYICILVCYMYRYTHEKFKCYLVQMMLTSHHRKISDSQPMIGLNEPKKSDNILEPTTTEPPYLHPNPFLLSSRKTSEVYIVCIDVVLYYGLCKLIRKKINKTVSIGTLVITSFLMS